MLCRVDDIATHCIYQSYFMSQTMTSFILSLVNLCPNKVKVEDCLRYSSDSMIMVFICSMLSSFKGTCIVCVWWNWAAKYLNNQNQQISQNSNHLGFNGTCICLCLIKLGGTERGTRFVNYAKWTSEQFLRYHLENNDFKSKFIWSDINNWDRNLKIIDFS